MKLLILTTVVIGLMLSLSWLVEAAHRLNLCESNGQGRGAGPEV